MVLLLAEEEEEAEEAELGGDDELGAPVVVDGVVDGALVARDGCWVEVELVEDVGLEEVCELAPVTVV